MTDISSNYLYLLRGLPGSGKTTLAQDLAQMYDAMGYAVTVLAADDYFYDDQGNYNFDRNSLLKAHGICQLKAQEAMIHTKTNKPRAVFIHNTSTMEKELKPYLEMVEVSSVDWIVRSLVVENRHGNSSTHGVPDHTLEAMRDRFSLKL